MGLTSTDTLEGTVGVAGLMFTSGNWDTAQTVTLTGADDEVDDNNVAYTCVTSPAMSIDSNYNTVNPDDVDVSNTDNDTG